MLAAQMCAHFLHFPGVDWLVTVAAVLSVSLALSAGLTHEDLGLGRAGLRTGARFALVIVLAVAVIVVIAVAIPPTRELFQNDAYRDLGTRCCRHSWSSRSRRCYLRNCSSAASCSGHCVASRLPCAPC